MQIIFENSSLWIMIIHKYTRRIGFCKTRQAGWDDLADFKTAQGVVKVAISYSVSLRNRRTVPVEAISAPHFEIALSRKNTGSPNDTQARRLLHSQRALVRNDTWLCDCECHQGLKSAARCGFTRNDTLGGLCKHPKVPLESYCNLNDSTYNKYSDNDVGDFFCFFLMGEESVLMASCLFPGFFNVHRVPVILTMAGTWRMSH